MEAIKRHIPRRVSDRELEILTGWHCVIDRKPAHGQRCRFAHIPDYVGFYESSGIASIDPHGAVHFSDGDKGGWISDPAHTYWMPL